MKKITIILIFVAQCAYGYAQISNLTGIDGVASRENKYTNIEGSPYLSESFNNGYVLTKDGRKGDFMFKYDAFEDKILYMQKNINYELSNTEVREFGYPDLNIGKSIIFRNGFEPYGNTLTANTFYQVLFDGKIYKFLKKHTALKMRNQLYNSASATISFQIEEDLFIAVNNKPYKIKNNKKNILSTLKVDDAVKKYVETKHWKLKTEAEIIEFLRYIDK